MVVLTRRMAAGSPFVGLGIAAIVTGGAIAAGIAHRPTQPLVWMVAYLVLVVGVMQVAFGGGQALLARRAPGLRTTWGQWVLFNLGNAGVIGGTLCRQTGVVALGTLVFVVAIAWFLVGVHRCRHHGWCVAFRVLLGLVFVSACVGLALSVLSNGVT